MALPGFSAYTRSASARDHAYRIKSVYEQRGQRLPDAGFCVIGGKILSVFPLQRRAAFQLGHRVYRNVPHHDIAAQSRRVVGHAQRQGDLFRIIGLLRRRSASSILTFAASYPR